MGSESQLAAAAAVADHCAFHLVRDYSTLTSWILQILYGVVRYVSQKYLMELKHATYKETWTLGNKY